MIWTKEIDSDFLATILREHPAKLVLCSPGGDVGIMLGALDYFTANPTSIRATGFVASAAIPILALGSPRCATPRTTFMVHLAQATVEGNTTDVVREGSALEGIEEVYWSVLEKRTKKSAKWWANKCSAASWYFSAAEALKLGLIDKIVVD